MQKSTLIIGIIACLVFSVPVANLRADILGSVGDVLKKGGKKAVELFKKGKEKISSLFNKADPKKLPHIVNKLSASQTALNEKQQALIKLTSQQSGSSSATLRTYMHERTSDLVQARHENEKLFQELQELLNALGKKEVDLRQYDSVLNEVHRAQAVLDKNQALLQKRLASYWPAGDGGKTEQTEPPDNKELDARLTNTANNPYAAAGTAKNGNNDDTVYGSTTRPSETSLSSTDESGATATDVAHGTGTTSGIGHTPTAPAPTPALTAPQ